MFKSMAIFVMAAVTAPVPAEAGIACHIETTDSEKATEIRAFVAATAPVFGTYRMATISETGGNRSASQQSGKFNIQNTGEPVLLSRLIMGMSPGRKITVQLTVLSSQETVDCSKTIK